MVYKHFSNVLTRIERKPGFVIHANNPVILLRVLRSWQAKTEIKIYGCRKSNQQRDTPIFIHISLAPRADL